MSAHRFTFDDLGAQVALLLGEVRLAAFARALRQAVGPDDVVADIGAGTGILGLIAARAGARRVFLVERGAMCALADEIVGANGLADRVSVLPGDARDVVFPEPPTIVVSETLGVFGGDEDIAGLLGVVRQRCAPGARVIPAGFEVVLALLDDPDLARDLDALGEVQGVALGPLRRRLAHRPAAGRIREGTLAGDPVGTGVVPLPEGPLPAQFAAQFRLPAPRRINAVGAWFRTHLIDGVELSTGPDAPPTEWAHLVFPVEPSLEAAPDQPITAVIQPRHIMHRGLWAWSVRAGDEVRVGDAYAAAGARADDLLAGLGLARRPRGTRRPAPRLAAWAAILQGRVTGDVDAMAARLLRAFPHRYADLADARHEVVTLLHAAGALA